MQPEIIVLLGAAFWVGAALATGIPQHRFPSEFPLLFAVIAAVGSLIGVTEMVPASVDIALTILAVVLYAITPIVFAWHLYRVYPSQDRTNSTNRQLNQD